MVVKSLKFSEAFPRTFFKHVFTDLTSLSQKPPHQAARSAINFQVIPLSVKNSVSSVPLNDFHSSFRSWSVLLNVLSEYITLHRPLLAINLFKAKRKCSVVWSETNYKCTALVTAQVKSAMYAFLDWPLGQTYNGPAKSTPVTSKGGDSVTLSLGNGAVTCCAGFTFSLLQMCQCDTIRLTSCLPFKIQYLSLTCTRVSLTPECITLSWQYWTSNSEYLWFVGTTRGCWSLKLKSECCGLPPTLISQHHFHLRMVSSLWFLNLSWCFVQISADRFLG